MGRGIEQVGIVLEHRLRAVAVMDVEIHTATRFRPCAARACAAPIGDVVEQAEAHGARRLGMVARRAHGAEGVARFAARSPHRPRRRPRRRRATPPRPIPARRRCRRRARRRPSAGIASSTALDILPVVHPRDLVDFGARRFAPVEQLELFRFQRVEHGAQPRRAFRMMDARVMLNAGLMGEQQGIHPAPLAKDSAPPSAQVSGTDGVLSRGDGGQRREAGRPARFIQAI